MNLSEFAAFAAYVEKNFGIQLPASKKALLESRLYKLFISPENALNTPQDLLNYLARDTTGKARALMADLITTHHTFFMREPDHFDFYKREVLPFQEAHIADGDVRTWCAAASSGEEAYTLAMMLMDHFALKGAHWETTLLATDLSREILAQAKAGIYPKEAIAPLPPEWQSHYFRHRSPGEVEVIQLVKERVLFRCFNLMTPVFPFKRPFHTIFCRNVMIYFDAPTRDALTRKFYDWLEPGGFLFVGHSEVLNRDAAPFRYVLPSVYQKA